MPERLDAALELAAETLEGYKELGPILGPSEEAAQEYLAGWAEAIRALANEPTRAISIQRQEAITKFIKAMLGGDDE